MADLLGSILGSMEKPPSIGGAARKKANEQQEKQLQKEREKLNEFREKIQKEVHSFIKDGTKQKYRFEPMEKVYRAIVHEVTDLAGLASFSFGLEEEDRYVMAWKKEFAPSDEELLAYRRGEEWDPEKAKAQAREKDELARQEAEAAKNPNKRVVPTTDYHEKYRHLIGDTAAKAAARTTTANKNYGFVPSDNKRDHRTIEQVLADTKAKKRLKTEHLPNSSEDNPDDSGSGV